jgi:HPt (histidine-containing phosphotransfer) domain-containing protein
VEGASYVEQITAAASTGDVGAIVRPAHSLKSSSAALGATRISQLSRSIESAGREGRGEGLAEAANEARTTWDATVAELKERGLTK